MMNIDAAVTVEHLTVVRGGNVVLPDLELTIHARSVTGLLGPSGCGKTTLIRSIAGIQVTRGGTVTALGSPAGSLQNRHRVGYMTQGSSTYPDLTVVENLRYFAALAGAARNAVDESLRLVDLTDKANELAGNLSGGERARVSLAAVGDPDLYLLDEPTVGLDPVLRRDLWQMFGDLSRQGKTLLVTSHVMDEAARCSRVVLMRAGRVIAHDTPDGLLSTAGRGDLEQAFLVLAEGTEAA